jgi:hypothetical protein
MRLNYELNDGDVKKYKEDGYIVCKNFFEKKIIEKIIISINPLQK